MGMYPFVLGLIGLVVGCASNHAATTTVATPPSPPATVRVTRVATSQEAQPGARDASAQSDESPTAQTEKDTSPPALVATLPTTCAAGKQCVPPREFAAATCRGRYASMALSMFEKHTPWQRLYVKVETLEAVNAYGERSTASPLVFGEEVIVLRAATDPKAARLVVSSNDIDVLRWDGTCATVAQGAFSTTRMANLEQATVDWRYLEDPLREALLVVKPISLAYDKHHSLCRGSRSTAMDPQCKKAAERLSEAITFAVRAGLTLPLPSKLPAWATPEQAKVKDTVAMTADPDE